VATRGEEFLGRTAADPGSAGIAAERGQASPEWVGVVLLLTLAFTSALPILGPMPLGLSLARAIGARLVCAVEVSDSCRRDPELVAAYGAELAAALRRHAPEVAYERGMHALPVDYRRCRSAACANGPAEGVVWRSTSGAPATAFVHVIDCRRGGRPAFAGRGPRPDCTARRGGNLYLQYWLYYPESATMRGVPVLGKRGYHRDDWECQ
jgi:hypothetical protein